MDMTDIHAYMRKGMTDMHASQDVIIDKSEFTNNVVVINTVVSELLVLQQQELVGWDTLHHQLQVVNACCCDATSSIADLEAAMDKAHNKKCKSRLVFAFV